MSSPALQKQISRGAAIAVPAILLGLIGYATYVVVERVCGRSSLSSYHDLHRSFSVLTSAAVEYLLNPSVSQQQLGIHPRHGAAIALLVIYFVFFALMLLCYFRTLQTIWTNPGLVPRRRSKSGEDGEATTSYDEKSRPNAEEPDVAGSVRRPRAVSLDRNALLDGSKAPPPGLEYFYTKDVFVCDFRGLPIYCTKCNNWKPDRTHHCSEIDRCVRRMDHFCPWVGGIVSETNMKFFMQFNAYAALYCATVLISLAVLLAERKHKVGDVDPQWAVILGIGAFFFLMTLGMAANSFMQCFNNRTTIEQLGKGNVVQLAVHIPRGARLDAAVPPEYHTITYPLPSSPEAAHAPPPANARTFAVLCTKPEENPWNLGPLTNFKTVMGKYWFDWLLPLKNSPCMNHDRGDSHFPVGPVVDRMMRDAGLVPLEEKDRRKRGRRRRSHGSHSTRSTA